MNIPSASERIHYWALQPDAVREALGVRMEGLSSPEVAERLQRFGPNTLPKDGGLGWMRILVQQFKSPLLLVLVAAGLVTLFLKEWGDAAIILGAVIVNAALGLYQELKAENTLALLENFVKDMARVTRSGSVHEIDSSLVVPGDIVHLRQGAKVPADGRIFSVNDLHIDESVLTGESLPIEKKIEPVPADTELADRTCCAFSGTTVVQGSGLMVVTATGKDTEFGAIALLVKGAEKEETPLQKALSRFTVRASLVLAVLTIVLFIIGLYHGVPLYEMFLISVATAVSAVPEGLPIALTVILAVGIERLARKKGVVKKLLAAETLGSTTLILTDKTGTLTEAKMELEGIHPHGASKESHERDAKKLLEYAVTHSDVLIENAKDAPIDWKISGSPVEIALVRGGTRHDAWHPRLREEFSINERLPFNSSAKFSASIVQGRGSMKVVLLGAPEIVLTMTHVTDAERARLIQEVDARAESGERVLALAIKDAQPHKEVPLAKQAAKKDAEFLGLISFRDRVRPTVRAAIEHIGRAGVRTVIVTGDHAGTAKTVAKEVGFKLDENSVLLGAEIAGMGDPELKLRLSHTKVIARTTPEQKLRIARVYKELGEVVAMTGDGVNDAPALREANIGIAVGAGTDVAKSSADLVILDNNFETIVAAIEEGRTVLQNIKKVIVYMLSNSFDELFLIGGALLMSLTIPLSATQILWVNLFADSFPAVALAFESHRADIGKRPSRAKDGLFDKEMQFLIVVVGTFTSVMLLALYAGLLRLGFDAEVVRTFIFAAFGLYTLFLVFSVRSLYASIFSYGLWSNRYLVGGTLVGFVMMGAAIYVPFLQSLFGTVALSLPWVLAVLAFGLLSIILREASKWLFRVGILKV